MPTLVPNDAALSMISSLLLSWKLICVVVPVAAATSSVAPLPSWKRPVLLGSMAVDTSSEPAMLTVPLSRTVGAILAPLSVQVAPASTARIWKLLNEPVPTPPIEPVPLASSSVLVPLPPVTPPTNTAPGSTTSRLVALPAKSMA